MRRPNDNEPLDGRVNIGNVVQDEPGQLLVLFLSDMTDETLASELFSHLVSGQTVLSKSIVERVDGTGTGNGELFLDLDEVGTTNKGDDTFFSQVLKKLDHLGFGGLSKDNTGCEFSAQWFVAEWD